MSGLNATGPDSKLLPTGSEASPHLHCPIASLPNELLETIMRHLSLNDLLRCSQVSATWRDIVSEQLVRTRSCALVTDQGDAHAFNTHERAIPHLMLRNADLWHCFKTERVRRLESFYFECGRCTPDVAARLTSMLRQCANLTALTLRVRSPLDMSQLEELLYRLKHVRSVCLIADHMDESFQKSLTEFFDHFHFFYDEIVFQVLNAGNEIVYVCSDQVTLHPHLHGRPSRVVFGHVRPALVRSVLSHARGLMRRLELDGTGSTTDETLRAIADAPHLECLFLHSFSNTNQALGGLFKSLKGRTTLRELNVANCSNMADEEIAQLEHLRLDRLDIDFRSCPAVSVEERFLNYCLTHVQSLRIWLDFNENVLRNFLGALEKSCSLEIPVVMKEININILRVNFCSKEVSDHIKDFKSHLRNLASNRSIKVNLAELFTRIKK